MQGWLKVLVSLILIGRISNPLIAQEGSTPSLKITASFDAVAGNPSASYKDHPDMAMAACSKCGKTGQVLVATGQDVTVYDSSGAALKSQSTEDFVKAAGLSPGKVNDPRATYDPFIGRWIVVCSCSADFLMVSAGNDATLTWKGVALTSATGDLTMFPGWDKNGVYISEYQPRLAAQYIALPSADVAWKGNRNISLEHRMHVTDRPYETRPAVDPNPDKKATDPEYLVARSGPPQNATNFPIDLVVDQIMWSGNTATVSGPINISSGFLYSKPESLHQPSGPDIRGVESHRVFSVAAYSSHLYLVAASGPCTSSCAAQGEDTNSLFFWFDVETSTMTIHQKAKVSHATLGYLFPTLAVDAKGNIGIAATGGSSTTAPSIYLFTHRAGDAPGTINGPLLGHAGTHSYSCKTDPVGWGTYSATVQDASDATKLWTLQEYAGSETPCVWKTRVLGFHIR
jgi:hypothetical protein